MDKIAHQVRAEYWIRILNECMNSGMSKTAWHKEFNRCFQRKNGKATQRAKTEKTKK